MTRPRYWTSWALLAVTCFSGVGVRSAAADVPGLSDEAAARCAAALKAISRGAVLPAIERRARESADAEFEIELGALAGALDERSLAAAREIEAADIEAKLVVLARDRQARPEIYEEILSTYVHVAAPDPPPIVIHPPKVRPAHATPEHRLPWEYVLLAPLPDGVSLHERRAVEALARIGDPASVVTAEFLFRQELAPEVELRRDGLRRQRGLLQLMARLPSPAAAGAIGRALALSEERLSDLSDDQRTQLLDYFRADDYVRSILSDEAGFGVKNRWLGILGGPALAVEPGISELLLDLVHGKKAPDDYGESEGDR